MKNIILVGGGGHALSVADAIDSKEEYHLIGYTDIVEKSTDLPYLGTDDYLSFAIGSGVRDAFICLGYFGGEKGGKLRDSLYNKVKELGYDLPIICDGSSVISKHADIGEGTFIGKRSVVNYGALIGKMSIINTGVIVEHCDSIGDFCHIATGTVLCGDVSIGNHVFVGAGSTIIQGVKIGSNSIIGAGSLILADVPEGKKVLGIWKGTSN